MQDVRVARENSVVDSFECQNPGDRKQPPTCGAFHIDACMCVPSVNLAVAGSGASRLAGPYQQVHAVCVRVAWPCR